MLAGSLLLVSPASEAAADTVDDVTSPTTPDVALIGDSPKAGEEATVRFTASDPDSGLDGFWYGINEEVKREFVAAPAPPGELGSAEIGFTVPESGGRMWVYVWARDIAGNFSNRAVFDFFAPRDLPPPPEAMPIARWPVDAGHTRDVVGNNHLTLAGVEGTDYDWTEDRFCLPESGLDLRGSGGAYAATNDAVITTDEPFSVAAWIAPGEPTGEDQTVLSQGGAVRPAVLLEQTAELSWRFSTPPVSPGRPGGVAETAPGSLQFDVWNHLAGVVDLVEGELRLYVNGELAVVDEIAATGWPARGPFYLGTAGTMQGTESPFHGIIDTVDVWSGRLTESQIRLHGSGGGGWTVPCF
jgi:hypothetical protein